MKEKRELSILYSWPEQLDGWKEVFPVLLRQGKLWEKIKGSNLDILCLRCPLDTEKEMSRWSWI